MKISKLSIVAAALALGLGTSAYAFHEGGVATCDGCHTMHNSEKGTKMTVNALPVGTANNFLLRGVDQSSTCLRCHSGSTTGSYKVLTFPLPAAGAAPVQYTPGGDFGWVSKSVSWTSPRAGSSAGERHGHNVIAGDYGLIADTTLLAAPGGTYAAGNLTCISCHDPHPAARIVDSAGTIETRADGFATLPIAASGSYGDEAVALSHATGTYRLLASTGYAPKSYVGAPAFTSIPPVAVAPSSYNRKETTTDTRVAYGKGMSEWCSNCHTAMHNDSYPANLRHPAGNAALLTAAVVTNYNQYVKSGDLTGVVGTSYTSMVPYEMGTGVIATLLAKAKTDGTVTDGPAAGTENVMCLSCHRAHGSGFNSLSRWNNATELLTVDGLWPSYVAGSTVEREAGGIANGYVEAEYKAAMYDRPAANYATFQRSLCNKCHAKD